MPKNKGISALVLSKMGQKNDRQKAGVLPAVLRRLDYR